MRQSLVERTEAMRTAEAKLLEVIVARGEADKKVEHLAVVSSGWEQQAKFILDWIDALPRVAREATGEISPRPILANLSMTARIGSGGVPRTADKGT